MQEILINYFKKFFTFNFLLTIQLNLLFAYMANLTFDIMNAL